MPIQYSGGRGDDRNHPIFMLHDSEVENRLNPTASGYVCRHDRLDNSAAHSMLMERRVINEVGAAGSPIWAVME